MCKKNITNGLGNKVAITFIDKNGLKQNLTYQQLENLIDCFINILLKKFKDKLYKNIVSIHSSANICSVISMLACTKLGITHCVLFEDLSNEAINKRIKLTKSKILITNCSDEDYIKKFKNNKKLEILRFVKKIDAKYNEISIKNFLKNKNIQLNLRYKEIKSNFPSFVLFTSGSTGEPKGIVHSTGGYLLYSKYTCEKQFGLNNKKTILTASDAGWINGHTYALYGPLSTGSRTIILESPLSLLNYKILKKIIFKEKVNILYLPVTLIRLLKAFDDKIKIKSRYLTTLGSMGEPLSYHIANWFSSKFSNKKLQIINTYFQTETAGIIASPKFNESIKSSPFGTVGKPINKLLGVFIDKKNELKIKNPWPGRLIGTINKEKVFQNYFDKKFNFKLFDTGFFDNNKNLVIGGRTDDVINVRGHRIGSAEIESVLLGYKKIKEVSAIGIEDEMAGNNIVIVASSNYSINKNIIEEIIVKNFGSFAIPKDIIIIKELPKTRSGKILRRLIKQIYLDPKNKKFGDTSTIINYKSLDDLRKKIIKNTLFK